MLKCYGYGFFKLLYELEARTVNETKLKKMKASEMWLYRRIYLKICWAEHATSKRVLERMKITHQATDSCK